MAVINNTIYSFIPNHLEIEDWPELRVFPNRVVYMSFDDNKLIAGVSSYVPVLETLEQTIGQWEMRYTNEFSNQCWLTIIYCPKKKSYCAEKYIRGELKAKTDGDADWEAFFTHVTMVGLQKGERCRFITTQEDIPALILPQHDETKTRDADKDDWAIFNLTEPILQKYTEKAAQERQNKRKKR